MKATLKEEAELPGPGAYEPKTVSSFKMQPSYSMKLRLKNESFVTINLNPGPGNYDMDKDTKKNAPKYGFGSSNRNTFKLKPGPGPGAYRVPTTVGDVPSYAIPNRPDSMKFV